MFDNSFNLGAYGAQGVFFPSGDISDFRNIVGDPVAEAALVANYQAQFDDARAAMLVCYLTDREILVDLL